MTLRYAFSFDRELENSEYWEDVAGAAQLQLDRVDDLEDDRLRWLRGPSTETLESARQAYETVRDYAEQQIRADTPPFVDEKSGRMQDKIARLPEEDPQYSKSDEDGLGGYGRPHDVLTSYADIPIGEAPDAVVTYEDVWPEYDPEQEHLNVERLYRNIENAVEEHNAEAQ